MDREIAGLYATNPLGTVYALVTGTHNLLLAAAKENHIPLHSQLAALSQFNETFAAHHDVAVTGLVYTSSNGINENLTRNVVVASAIWAAEEAIEVLNDLGQTDAAARFAGLVRNALERIAVAWPAFADQIIYGLTTYQQALEHAATSLRLLQTGRYDAFLSILRV